MSIESRRGVLVALLLFYCLPHVIILILALLEIFHSPSGLVDTGKFLSIVEELARRPGVYLNPIHQMILAVATAVTAASPLSRAPTDRLSRALSCFMISLPLITIVTCVVNGLIFSVFSVLSDSDKGVVTQYFVNSASNLSLYLMMLVGLRIRAEPQLDA